MNEYISSKSNEKIKEARKLSEKKYRLQYGLFIIEGRKLIYEYLRSGGVPQRVFLSDDVSDRYCKLAENSGCGEIYSVPRSLYEYISTENAPEGIMAVCPIPAPGVMTDGKCVILESLRDAGNLGTVIRTAAAFGIENVVLSSDCADLYNPKTLRAAMGAVFFANTVIEDDLTAFAEILKKNGRRVFASVPSDDALDVRCAGLRSDDCLVIGNEGNGISAALAEHCTGKLTIPMSGGAESLNASAAASVLMWELVRGGDLR